MEMNVLLSEGLAVDQRRMFILSHKASLHHTQNNVSREIINFNMK